MSTSPSPDWSEIQIKELCGTLDTELEIVGNLIYLISQRRQQPSECVRYLEVAQAAVYRMRMDIQKIADR